MLFLKLRGRRAGGAITPLIVDKPNRWSSRQHERALKKSECQLICGAADSGKSRWLIRLHDNWQGVWGAKCKHPPVFLCATAPVSSWTDNDHVADWHDKADGKAMEKDPDHRARPWAKLNQQQRADRLSDYLQATKSVVFIDDAHRLSGRKLQVARRCMCSARLWIVSASRENRLPPNLRTLADQRDPQRTVLATDASYDATGLLVWFLILAAVAIGWWEAALIFGGLKMLGTGRTASRAE